MTEISRDEILARAELTGLDIDEPELSEVYYYLNVVATEIESLNPDALDGIEPFGIPGLAHIPLRSAKAKQGGAKFEKLAN